jgi:dienelactone hydrolase
MRLIVLSYFIGLLLVNVTVFAEIKGENVDYTANGTTLKGYLAYDDAIKDQRPGILVVHEWWGHNEYARKRARMLAELGYVALAVDMYGDGKTADHPKQAGQFAQELLNNMEIAQARFMAALELLKQQKSVDANKIAAIGYCFGGGIVLTMARNGVDLAGVASFHGSLATKNPAKAGAVKAKIIVFQGEADKFVTAEQVKAFQDEMKNAQADLELVTYPGVKHSFTNPEADNLAKKFDLPLGYDETADKDSWAKLQVFLQRIFTNSSTPKNELPQSTK